MNYTVVRDDNGIVVGVMLNSVTFIPKDPKNRDWRKFLEWNSKQNPPLDLSDQFDLAAYKRRKVEAIQAKSETLSQAGFNHLSRTFVLDTDMMFRLLLIFLRRGTAGTFPVKIPTKFGRTLTLADAAAFDSFCNSLIAKHRAIQERAGELIESVTVAADKAAVDAIVDDRT